MLAARTPWPSGMGKKFVQLDSTSRSRTSVRAMRCAIVAMILGSSAATAQWLWTSSSNAGGAARAYLTMAHAAGTVPLVADRLCTLGNIAPHSVRVDNRAADYLTKVRA